MLNLNLTHGSPSGHRGRVGSEGNSRSGSIQGRRSQDITVLEEEDEDVEEVEEFSPIAAGEQEVVMPDIDDKLGDLPFVSTPPIITTPPKEEAPILTMTPEKSK